MWNPGRCERIFSGEQRLTANCAADGAALRLFVLELCPASHDSAGASKAGANQRQPHRRLQESTIAGRVISTFSPASLLLPFFSAAWLFDVPPLSKKGIFAVVFSYTLWSGWFQRLQAQSGCAEVAGSKVRGPQTGHPFKCCSSQPGVCGRV